MKEALSIKKYIEKGEGDPILLLHGLFGALNNWDPIINHFSKKYKIITPTLPIYDLPLKETSLSNFLELIQNFILHKNLSNVTIIGNSLGGHLAIMYTLKYPEKINKLVLTGSSGLFEDSMGGSFPKRGNYEYISERARYTVYDPKVIDQSYIDEIFEIIKDSSKALKIITVARSAQRNNLSKELPKLKTKTLLIWGINDTITPAYVAHEFHKLIPNSTLRFIDKCCHAPMMENPKRFIQLLENFL